jgi:VanZ family protein
VKNVLNILAIIFIGFVVWVLVRADANQPTIFQTFAVSLPYGDKIGHFCLFGTFSLLLNFTLKLKRIPLAYFNLKKRSIYLGSLCVLSFAVIEEFSQLMFAPQRTFDLIDLLADICGIATAHVATHFIATRYIAHDV